jgi:putative membrane protein
MMPGGTMWGQGWWGPGFGLFHWLFMLLFWVLIIAGAFLVIRWLVDQASPAGTGVHDTALEILKKRYARGEITKDQYEAMKQDLI